MGLRFSFNQADIDQFEKDFKEGRDPFHDLEDDFHMNSVSGILKMWFRKLPEPIFSNESFDQMMSVTSKIYPKTLTNLYRELPG